MKKFFFIFLTLPFLFFISLKINADTLGSILSAVSTISSYEQGAQFSSLNNIGDSISQLQEQLLQNIKSQIGTQITGSYGLGSYNWNQNPSLQYLGDENGSWEDTLKIYENGGNPGDLASTISTLNQQFPIQSNLNTVTDFNTYTTNQNYYDVQAQTALAARAASQVSYDNLQKEITYEESLEQQIDTTGNIKAAIDLQNRLQVENNLIELNMLRLEAVNSQQQSIASQGDINATVSNASFFDLQP